MTAAQSKEKRSPRQKKRLVWLTEAQAALSWLVILVLVALLGAIYLFQTSRTASVGRRIQNLQIDLDKVKRENSELELNIAEAQSLERLQAEAERLGFVRAQPEDIEYLVVPDYPQLVNQANSPEREPAARPIDTIDELLWLIIEKSFSNMVQGEAP
jgi:cell division protein FtsL